MKRLLYYGENPFNPTGFGQMSGQILAALNEVGWDIEVVATSVVEGQLELDKLPYRLLPCPAGSDDLRNEPLLRERMFADDLDCFFYMGDFGANDHAFVALGEARKLRPSLMSVAYCPLDCDVLTSDSFNYMRAVNVPVVYTEHGKRRIEHYCPDLVGKLSVIWPGCEPDVFYPLSAEERKQIRHDLFSIDDDALFLVVNVNRNQQRKDIARGMACFHEFHKAYPHSTLYLHSVMQDLGGNLPFMAMVLGMNVDGSNGDREIVFSPMSLTDPFSRADLNKVYNAADLLLSTTTGEGWGLATTEAMAAGLPVLVPGNTANLDIVGKDGNQGFMTDERGLLIEAGGDIDHQQWMYGMSSNPRDIIHSEDCIQKLGYAHNYPRIIGLFAKHARLWTEQHTWKVQGRKWQQLLETLGSHLEQEAVEV